VAQRVDAAEVRTGSGAGRRDVVLIAALETFLRYGYRKTSMEDIASAAHISRPGLYFLFASKRELFAAAITRALEQDLHTAAHALDDEAHLLHERLLEAFDTWTGRYLGAWAESSAQSPKLTATSWAQQFSTHPTAFTR